MNDERERLNSDDDESDDDYVPDEKEVSSGE